MIEEEWRPVIGQVGAYEVSSFGRVRSVDRIMKRKHWDRYSATMMVVDYQYRGHLLRPGPRTSGHLSVALGRAGGSRDVHVLVLEAFIGPCPDGHEGCHWDDNPANNAIGNLRWGTRSSNLHDAVRNGKRQVGDRHRFAKLKNSDIPKIRAMLGSISYAEIGRRYGVNEATIRQIKDGRAWRTVP